MMENTDKRSFSIMNIVCKINILKIFQIIKLLELPPAPPKKKSPFPYPGMSSDFFQQLAVLESHD